MAKISWSARSAGSGGQRHTLRFMAQMVLLVLTMDWKVRRLPLITNRETTVMTRAAPMMDPAMATANYQPAMEEDGLCACEDGLSGTEASCEAPGW